jgi:AcrR family transcriptional regulator
MFLHGEARIDTRQARMRSGDLERSDAFRTVEGLSVDVAFLDGTDIEEADHADAGNGEAQRCRAAAAGDADDEDLATLKALRIFGPYLVSKKIGRFCLHGRDTQEVRRLHSMLAPRFDASPALLGYHRIPQSGRSAATARAPTMPPMRTRAIRLADKHERYRSILDAAERLLVRSPAKLASVAEVAEEAGLAKGTVYLYFASKEALLLALYERNVDGLFHALAALLDGRAAVIVDDVCAVIHEYIVGVPSFLALANRCSALMSQDRKSAWAFANRLAGHLDNAASGLRRHFDALDHPQAVALLRNSYALAIGLRQIASEEADLQSTRAMLALWKGTLAAPAAQSAEPAGDPDRFAGDAAVRRGTQEHDRIGHVAARR